MYNVPLYGRCLELGIKSREVYSTSVGVRFRVISWTVLQLRKKKHSFTCKSRYSSPKIGITRIKVDDEICSVSHDCKLMLCTQNRDSAPNIQTLWKIAAPCTYCQIRFMVPRICQAKIEPLCRLNRQILLSKHYKMGLAKT